jgi:hypothetical protein
MRECTRRTFIRVAVGAAVAGVAAPNDAREANAVRELNYERFRQRLRAIAEEGAVIKWCSLAGPRDGSRAAQVYVEGRSEPLRFEQPWDGDCI